MINLLKKRPISLRWILLALLTVPLVVTVSTIGYISYRAGEQLVDDLVDQFMNEAADHITTDLDRTLHMIEDINQSYLIALKAQTLTPNNLDQIHRYSILKLFNFTESTALMFATPQGQIRVVSRVNPEYNWWLEPDELLYHAAISDPNHSNLENIYSLDLSGNLKRQILQVSKVPFLDRPWYGQAVETGEPGWTEPVQIGPSPLMGIYSYAPSYDSAQNLQGVFAVALSLDRISDLLGNFFMTDYGRIFIMDRQGFLIADSTGGKVYHSTQSTHSDPSANNSYLKPSDISIRRLRVEQNDDFLISKTGQQILNHIGDLENITSSQQFPLDRASSDGFRRDRQYVMVFPYQYQNLDWLVVICIPQSQFMSSINRSLIYTVSLGALILIAVMVGGVYMVNLISHPLRKLSRSSQKIAQGNWQENGLGNGYKIKELDVLSGSFNGMVKVLKEAQDRLQESLADLNRNHHRLENFLNAIPVGIRIIDPQGKMLYANQQAFNITGKSLEKIGCLEDLPEVFEAYIRDTDIVYPYEQLPLVRALQGEVSSVDDIELRQGDRRIPVEAWGTPIYDGDGKIEYAMVAFQEISDRHKAEQQIRQLSERLNLALSSGKIGCWEWDITQNQIIWDKRMYEIHGISYPENAPPIKEIWKRQIHPQDSDRVYTQFQQAIADRTPLESQFRIIHEDGTLHYIKGYGILRCDRLGNPQSLVGVNIDITDLKTIEIKHQKTNLELLRANRLKDEFIANMSHELRTPLNAILGMTEGLKEQVFGSINTEQNKALNTIERSSTHLLALINEILDLAKIQSGKIELELGRVAIAPLCSSSLTFVKQLAHKKQIELNTEIPLSLPDLWVDERRIRQVLINLLNNAVKFTEEGGKITVDVSVLEDGQRVRIGVRDTGIGISADNLSKLFQPFIQIDSALNRQYTGTGLGLALVKQIVELHQGEVQVRSEVGVGSCFMIDLPYIPALEKTGESQHLNAQEVSNGTSTAAGEVILLAEDNEANITTVCSYLKAKGYQMLLAHNGQQAVELAKVEHPDLILMDIQMPGMDGLEAMEKIRCDPELKEIPIIALTALAMTEDRDRAIAAGANEYLSKPVKLKQLATTIARLLNPHG